MPACLVCKSRAAEYIIPKKEEIRKLWIASLGLEYGLLQLLRSVLDISPLMRLVIPWWSEKTDAGCPTQTIQSETRGGRDGPHLLQPTQRYKSRFLNPADDTNSHPVHLPALPLSDAVQLVRPLFW